MHNILLRNKRGQNLKERTLTIIKPDAIEKKCFGKIIQRILDEGFDILNLKYLQLSKEQAEAFYSLHREKPFFEELIKFMTSSPVIVMVLEREDGVDYLRKIMGATDPKKAKPSTIRYNFGSDIQKNAIHGSDSCENAEKEIKFFFSEY